MTELKLGDIIRNENHVYKVAKFDHGIPELHEIKVLVQFD